MTDWLERYLNVLQVERAAPSLAYLARLCRAQVTRIPFENVSAILRRARTPSGPVPPLDLDAVLQTWEARAGGGVCVDGTPMFRRLLQELGFTARPVLAQISFPDSHQASVVSLDGHEYLVDVANGAPFFEPIPLDQETIVSRAGLAWRFRREDQDTFVQDRHIEGTWTPFCRYELRSPDPQRIEAAYQLHHTPGASWVVGNLTVVRSEESNVARLRDAELLRYSESGPVTELIQETDLPRLADEVFDVPALPLVDAAHALREARAKAR